MNKLNHPSFGLVLTGGAAKGAYQVGALKYIAEIGLIPDIIAGTSIGALNGAVLASSDSFNDGVTRLELVWKKLGNEIILRPNSNKILETISYASQLFAPNFKHWLIQFLTYQGLLKDNTAIFDPEPIEKLLRETVNLSDLKMGIELWVTVFPSLNIPGLSYDWMIDLIRSQMGVDAHWFCTQDCQDQETLYNLLLASSALPFAFPSRQVNGKYYIDGGLADNVPVRALKNRGCQNIIVIHLHNGVTWNRHDFPQQTIIEIRPEKPINKSENPLDIIDTYLDFTQERITDLKQRGYEDAKKCLETIIETFITVKSQRKTQELLINSTEKLLNDSHL